MRLAPISLFVFCACFQTLPIRGAFNTAASADLRGLTVSTFDVSDVRGSTGQVGRHRDGFARVTQRGW